MPRPRASSSKRGTMSDDTSERRDQAAFHLEAERDALRDQARQRVLEMFDEPRLANAAIACAEAVDVLSREERLIVLLFPLMSTLPHVADQLKVDVAACVNATAQNEELGAAVWLHVARELGIGITTTRPSPM